MENTTLEERLALAREKGFSCVHLASKLIYSEYGIDRRGLTPGLAAHIRREFKKNELDIAVYGCYLNLAHPDPAKLGEIIEEYKANIRFASYLQAPLVGTETGAPNAEYRFSPECRSEEAFQYFLKNLDTVVDFASTFAVTIAIEPVFRHIIHSPERARRVLDTLGRDHLQLIFDPVNMLDITNHRQQGKLFDEMLAQNGSDIALLHAKDFTVGTGSLIPCAPGTAGNLNYSEILKWQRKYKPFLQATIENSTPQNAEDAQRFLREAASC